MNWIRPRGRTATGRASAGRSRRGAFGCALVASLIASLALSISAFAAAGPGVNGTGLVTTPDAAPQGYTQPQGYVAPANDGLGVKPGQIKHVWVIVLENKAYDASFTGSNANSYLWQTLPQDGALLTNYYGTGHSSLDNYLTMASGQAPVTDDQDDCPAYNSLAGSVDTAGGSLKANPNYGQFESAAGPDAPAGDNGCVYPSSVPTVFNQLDAARKSWKVYAQDVAYPGVAGQNAGITTCGAPDATVGPTPSAGQTTNPGASGSPYYVKGSASATSGYVAKHNPLPWFQSIIGSNECKADSSGGTYANSKHLGELFGPSDALYGDLQNASSTPDLSFIIPNNCSNGHDAVCTNDAAGPDATNNLSGGFTGQTPNAPLNSVGGLYASDKFLEHVIPEIQESPAYAEGGLIAVVWDESYPPFTYSNDSFVDSNLQPATAFGSLTDDSGGETLFGRSLSWEPSGPNVPNIQSATGQQLAGGPGYNEYLDRPNTTSAALSACTNGTASISGNGFDELPAGGCLLAGGTSGAGGEALTSITGSATAGSTSINVTASGNSGNYGLPAPNDEGETVALPNGVSATAADGNTAGPWYVGQVTSHAPAAITASGTDTTATDQASSASFELVDANGSPATLSTSFVGQTLTLGGETAATDPLYDAYDATTGGGDTGALLLSPYIKGGTVSNTNYNHYSLLRTIEDIFQVSSGSGKANGYAGPINVSTGVDGEGHLGYAAQPGLAPFGPDVFTNVSSPESPR